MGRHRLAAAARALALAAAAALAPPANAATVDDVRFVRVAEVPTVRLVFAVPVRVAGITPRGEADVFQVRLELAPVTDPALIPTAPEVRQVAGEGGSPAFTLTLAPGTTPRTLELTLQLRERRSLQARAGANAREVDLVFSPGAAPAEPVAATTPPATDATAAAKPDDAALQAMEDQAARLMDEARQALAAGRAEEAVNRLNQVLLLPPNRQSASAQALIGDAWSALGDSRRARVEYDLYLKLHPQGASAAEVAAKLAALGGALPRASAGGTEASAAAPRDKPATRTFTGSIAQYLSGGKARSKSLVNLPSGINQETLSTTTESAVVTSVDLGARWETADADVRGVVRGSGSANLSSTSHSQSLLSAAYVDYKRHGNGLALRVGRQSAVSGGLLGLFDGVSLAYPLREGVKLDVMGGVPANTLVSSPSQRLWAAMLELDGLLEKWGGNLYLLNQTSEGYVNRRALGAEVRYADEVWSGYAIVDYDIELRALNAVSVQGSWQLPGQTTLTVLLDDRKAPSLALTNALISHPHPSIAALLQANPGLSLAQVREWALQTSAHAQQAMVSVSRPINERWQLSADLRASRIGALPEVGDFAATQATGVQYTATVQLTGTNLYSSHDINNINLSLMTTPYFKGAQLALSNLTSLRDNDLTLEPSLRLYTQSGPDGLKVQRVSPGLRVSYRASRRLSMLGEALVEHSSTSGPDSKGSTNAGSFYMGYRYELF